jgi:hypothetical protein
MNQARSGLVKVDFRTELRGLRHREKLKINTRHIRPMRKPYSRSDIVSQTRPRGVATYITSQEKVDQKRKRKRR